MQQRSKQDSRSARRCTRKRDWPATCSLWRTPLHQCALILEQTTSRQVGRLGQAVRQVGHRITIFPGRIVRLRTGLGAKLWPRRSSSIFLVRMYHEPHERKVIKRGLKYTPPSIRPACHPNHGLECPRPNTGVDLRTPRPTRTTSSPRNLLGIPVVNVNRPRPSLHDVREQLCPTAARRHFNAHQAICPPASHGRVAVFRSTRHADSAPKHSARPK
jgi:hypothetical protein